MLQLTLKSGEENVVLNKVLNIPWPRFIAGAFNNFYYYDELQLLDRPL